MLIWPYVQHRDREGKKHVNLHGISAVNLYVGTEEGELAVARALQMTNVFFFF